MNPFASALIQEDMICHLFCELGLHILISSLRFRLNSPPPHLGGLRNRFLRFALFSDYGSLLQAMTSPPSTHWTFDARARPPVRLPSLLFSLIPSALLSSQLKMVAPRSLTLASIQVKLSRWMCMWRRRRGRGGREGALT